jgi:hypothetical protein
LSRKERLPSKRVVCEILMFAGTTPGRRTMGGQLMAGKESQDSFAAKLTLSLGLRGKNPEHSGHLWNGMV